MLSSLATRISLEFATLFGLLCAVSETADYGSLVDMLRDSIGYELVMWSPSIDETKYLDSILRFDDQDVAAEFGREHRRGQPGKDAANSLSSSWGLLLTLFRTLFSTFFGSLFWKGRFSNMFCGYVPGHVWGYAAWDASHRGCACPAWSGLCNPRMISISWGW
ncbi:hypothetical protein B0T26DRAFT_508060 [Lasiosphaeria miniovina]|uniref:Uncharacterized protein n=1 Tax=Lasiosphaeria miniovina TaxID=1954250 RepID=A0AA39ZTV7_9PEZI|nr:uncharacterized protein B0T26DRAFT_508060 [Lasiosphaeria miniovina]KAK0703636.1 hypothetical protein B0T26DRAFT_508060 [Lasiosphaeria miniovina]